MKHHSSDHSYDTSLGEPEVISMAIIDTFVHQILTLLCENFVFAVLFK